MPLTHINRQIASLNQRVQLQQSVSGGPMKVSGFIEVTGTGEATVPVYFPVTFLERPVMSSGFEVAQNQNVQSGIFPTSSCGVANWSFTVAKDTGRRYYNGATLVIVTTGADGQLLIVHYAFEGRAIQNPFSAASDTGSQVG